MSLLRSPLVLLLLGLLATGNQPPHRAAPSQRAPSTSLPSRSFAGPLSTARARHTATLLLSGQVLVVGGTSFAGQEVTAELFDPDMGSWNPTSSMSIPREKPAAVLLPSGKVLVAGGENSLGQQASAELYDPATGAWSFTGSMATARKGHTLTLLPSGKVLAAGGWSGAGPTTTAELYDPVTGTWSPTGGMATPRDGLTATLLPSGKVLVAGGWIGSAPTALAELYDPATGAWSATGAMNELRDEHTATLLPSGQVLVAGGWKGDGPASSTELYDPVTGLWTPTGNMASARNSHTATLLPSGQVMVTGGWDGGAYTSMVEVYDATSGSWSRRVDLSAQRYQHTATLLPSGSVLVVGGLDGASIPASTAEILAAPAGEWAQGANMVALRAGHTGTLLPSGKVLVTGGQDQFGTMLAVAELFDPATGTWTVTGSMATARRDHTATLLRSGKVLVVGGYGAAAVDTAELYDPVTGTWSPAGTLAEARSSQFAVVLPSGKVLIGGGWQNGPLASTELYDPATGSWSPGGLLGEARSDAAAVLLPSGKVLATGGWNTTAVSTAELYDPVTGSWSPTGTMGSGRSECTLTVLPSGKVLATGGYDGSNTVASTELYDPATGAWTLGPWMQAQRSEHEAVLLPSGRVLVAGGGFFGGEVLDPLSDVWVPVMGGAWYHSSFALTLLASGKVLAIGGYDGSSESFVDVVDEVGAAAGSRPTVSAPDVVTIGQPVTVRGTGFLGHSEASSGGSNSSPTNFPSLMLLPANGGAPYRLAVTSFSDTQASTAVPAIPAGHYLLWVSANAISGGRLVRVQTAPQAIGSSITTAEDTPVPVPLGATDPDGDALSYTVLTGPSHGTLAGTAPALTYTPAPDYHGPDSFTFKVNDGLVDSNVATVTLTVTSVNDAPVAQGDSKTTAEDTAVAMTLNATDVDGDSLTYTVVTPPAHGTLSGTAPALTYTPAQDYNGQDSFTYRANDGTTDSNVATVTLTVTPVNDAPVAQGDSKTTAEDTAVAVTLNATDVDGDTLTYTVVTPPAHGTLSGTAPALTYTPAQDYNGQDSFTYRANDGARDSNVATVTLTVTPVNDAPVAQGDSKTTAEDTAVAVALSATDVDGDALTYTVVTPPAHGTLSGTAPALTYTPAADFHGQDSFTYRVNDGTTDSNVATVTLTITPVNDAPVAQGGSVTTAEDTAAAVMLSATDVDGDSLTYTVVTPPAHGSLSGTAPALTYTPAADYHGPDSFTYRVNDGTTDSNVATVMLTVTSVNDAPVVQDVSQTMAEETVTLVMLLGSDVDGDPLTYTVVSGPAHGTLSGTAPALMYTPAANYHGQDTFTYRVNDGTVDSNIATATVTVTPVNDAPVAENGSQTTSEDTPVAVALTAADVDGDTLTYTVVTQPAHGTLSGTAPALTYTPAANYHGSDSFTFRVNDGTVDSNDATVSLTVTPVNDAPVVAALAATVNEDSTVNVALSATDPDGDAVTYRITRPPAHGTLTGTPPNVVYAPAADFNGSDSFIYVASDGTVDSAEGTVSITVQPVNDAPVAQDGTATTTARTPVNVTLSASDVDGATLTYSVVTQPAHGTLSGTGSELTYTPTGDFSGTDSFTFRANDGTADSNVATVTLTVTPRAGCGCSSSEGTELGTWALALVALAMGRRRLAKVAR